ncbi:MAG: hypothetical protein CVV21_05750 [Candidatus Goldiibacteriota bacterium HGW-Goldbacteria-1]|jgi:Leucine-rich repeat (LRR) protein|nr:MAG: hypothetical protein CVV21_05750 [Candidatus Goldiibacteriota bacterium HGW-Goldbacteria-1]
MDNNNDQVKPTIVGARPPEDIKSNITAPGGVQVLLYKAKSDREFRKELILKRSASAILVGIALDETEADMLDSVPLQQLEWMIGAIKLPDEKLKIIKNCTAAALIAAAGLIPAIAAGGCSNKRNITGADGLQLQITNTPQETMTSTETDTPIIPSATFTGTAQPPSATNTDTNTPQDTATNTYTHTPSSTYTNTGSSTSTPTVTHINTFTQTNTKTATHTYTNTFLPGTPSYTYTATYTSTSTSTTAGILSTPTHTYTGTKTNTSTPTITPGGDTFTPTNTSTSSNTPTNTPTATSTPTDVVLFPDPVLQARVRSAIGKPTGTIYSTDLTGITYLTLSDATITNMSGIEYLVNLQNLYMTNAAIADYGWLTAMAKLQYIKGSGSNLKDMTLLSGLTLLRKIDMSGSTGLTGLTSLKDCPALTELYLSNCGLTDISFVTQLINLNVLDLYLNPITNVPPLSGLTSLYNLNLSRTGISDISGLSGLNLSTLSLSGNNITDISAIAGMTGMLTINLIDNPNLSDVSALSGMELIYFIYLSNTKVSDTMVFSNCTRLRKLMLVNTQVTEIPGLVAIANKHGFYSGAEVDLTGCALSDQAKYGDIPYIKSISSVEINY